MNDIYLNSNQKLDLKFFDNLLPEDNIENLVSKDYLKNLIAKLTGECMFKIDEKFCIDIEPVNFEFDDNNNFDSLL